MLLAKFCTNCGTEFEEAAKFCVECGQRRSEIAPPPEEIIAPPPEEITTSPPEPQIESPELDAASNQNLGSVDSVVEEQASNNATTPIVFVVLSALFLVLIYGVFTAAGVDIARTPSAVPSSNSAMKVDIFSISPSDFEILDENWAYKLTVPTGDCLTLAGSCLYLDTVTNQQCKKGRISYDLIDGDGVERRLYDDFLMTSSDSSEIMSKSFMQLAWQSSRWQDMNVVAIFCLLPST